MIRQDWSTLKKLMFAKTAAGGAAAVEATATGNPLTFLTDLAKPLKSLLIPFTPKQTGSGDPSPSNIRPIVPWDGLTVFGGEVNQFDGQMELGTYNGNTGAKSSSSTRLRNVNPIKVKAGTNYHYISNRQTDYGISWLFYKKDGTFISNNNRANTIDGFNIPVPNDAYYMNISTWDNYGTVYGNDIGINYPSTETAYEPYVPVTETDISFPSPVYGGEHEAANGKLMSFYALLTKNTASMNNSEDYPGWKNSGIEDIIGTGVNELLRNVLTNVSPVSNLSVGANTAFSGDVLYLNKSFFNKTQSEWQALAIDIQILVPLATPQEIQLTPQQITALVGNNTIWSDADGSMTAIYLKKG